MATISKRVCDRCGNEMKYVGWTSVLTNRYSSIKILKLLNGNHSGYDYGRNEYEMCTDCTKEFEKFLNSKMSDK